jgi:hypothetical protein
LFVEKDNAIDDDQYGFYGGWQRIEAVVFGNNQAVYAKKEEEQRNEQDELP